MSDFTASLAYLVDSVKDNLGDVAPLVGDPAIERWLNEGQRRCEPTLLRERRADVSWTAGATSFTLPDDWYATARWEATTSYQSVQFPCGSEWGGEYVFDLGQSVAAWGGRIFYRAHWPAITGDQDCLLPGQCIDALISYAAYKAYHKIAADRALYQRYSTLVTNPVTVDDLRQLAETMLRDFEEMRDEAPIQQIVQR